MPEKVYSHLRWGSTVFWSPNNVLTRYQCVSDMVPWSSGDAGERGGIPPPVSPPCHRFGRWGRGAVFGSAFIVAGDGDSTAGIGSIPDPETGGAGGAALIIQIAIDPGGGCLKQIDQPSPSVLPAGPNLNR